MFHHKNMAVDGLYPGLTTHWSIAVLGHLEFILDIVTPPTSGGGGVVGSIGPISGIPNREVTITVRYKEHLLTKTYSVYWPTNKLKFIVSNWYSRIKNIVFGQASINKVDTMTNTAPMADTTSIQVSKPFVSVVLMSTDTQTNNESNEHDNTEHPQTDRNIR